MKRSKAEGFTLLEVVVAMTIVGLGVVTLLEIFSSGMRLGARSSVHTEGIAQARQVMDEFIAAPTWRDGTERGKIDADRHWKIEVRPLKEPPLKRSGTTDWELKEVVLEMFVTDAGRERRLELKTLRLMKKRDS
jgi:prepilin-type N-terminal cleavage/methylation domain-containing protein